MVEMIDPFVDDKLHERINIQFLLGIVGLIIGFGNSILIAIFNLLAISLPLSELITIYGLGFAISVLNITTSSFVAVGILGLLQKHRFEYTWIIVLLLMFSLLFTIFDPYLSQWILETTEDYSAWANLSFIRTIAVSIAYAFCYWSIRDSVRNKILHWNLFLGVFYTLGLRYVWWVILFGSGGVTNPEYLQLLLAHVGSIAITIIYGLLVIALFIDERKYRLQPKFDIDDYRG